MKPQQLVQAIENLSDTVEDRMDFHKGSHEYMRQMGNDEFVAWVFEKNLKDKGFINRQWSKYETPFLYIHETDHFNLRYHVFLPTESGNSDIAANLIHHHNNYLLSSFIAYGPGYDTLHFTKDVEDSDHENVKIRITKDFHHGLHNISMVDSWEPHLVFNGGELTTTLVMWSPDKRMSTDKYRNHPVIKPFKKSLLKVIHMLGAEDKFGVAPKDVLQYYVEGEKVKAVREVDFFKAYKDQVGEEVNDFYVQAICKFIQLSNYQNKHFLESIIKDSSTPKAYKRWLQYLLDDQEIPMLYSKEEQNIPKKYIYRQEVLKACS